MKDENLTRKINLDEWPSWSPDVPVTDRDALLMARLVLQDTPRSYIEAAKRLAQYIVDLNHQMGDIEDMAEIFAHEPFDTIPTMQAVPALISVDE
jgi:hypothetical protein